VSQLSDRQASGKPADHPSPAGASHRAPGVRPADAPDVPAWEDAPLAQEIFLLNNLMQRVGDRLISGRGLTAARWMLLGALDHFDAPPSLTELASDGLMSPQNVSKLVADLAADGFVERFTVQGKGRSVFVRKTEKGEAVCGEAEAESHVFARWFLEGVSPSEAAAARTLLVRLIRNTRALERALVEGGIEHARATAPFTGDACHAHDDAAKKSAEPPQDTQENTR
jgi:DNA-binding MarR family transcriptional regulator